MLDSETSRRVAAFNLMEDWLLWFLLAIGLFVGEMFTAGFWLACLAVGAAVAGVVGLVPGLGFVVQGIAFTAASILSMAGLRPRLMHYFQLGPGSELRTGVDALLGKTGIVTERIGPGLSGRVKVEGEDWRGASTDATVIEPGTQVMIIQVDGTTLMVEKEP
jgi:membrane protein implicated in regulation of membrane protease activity